MSWPFCACVKMSFNSDLPGHSTETIYFWPQKDSLLKWVASLHFPGKSEKLVSAKKGCVIGFKWVCGLWNELFIKMSSIIQSHTITEHYTMEVGQELSALINMCVKKGGNLSLNVQSMCLDNYYEEVITASLRGACGREELCRLQNGAAYPDYCDGSKCCVLCSPGTTGEVRDWITAPIDYCSHHCPSERPGQEMHPPPCGLLGGTPPLYCLQSEWLAVNHSPHFVNGATVTWSGCAFSWDYLISELFPGSPLWCCLFEVLNLRQLCWTVALSSIVPRGMMLSVIPLHSLNNEPVYRKQCLQTSLHVCVFTVLLIRMIIWTLILFLNIMHKH